MVFAGSDWCRPCIQFKREILLQESFTSYASENLVLLYLDFPSQKKNKLSEEQTAHNEKLAEKYNPRGAFPAILLFDKDEKLLGKLSFRNQGPETFVEECKKLTPAAPVTENAASPVKKVVKLMGCRFEITAVANTDTIAWSAIQAGIDEITRIEKLISSWDTASQTSEVNRMAGIQPVVVDKELFGLIYRAKKISRLTNGAFDISFASMERIYSFNGEDHDLPDSANRSISEIQDRLD